MSGGSNSVIISWVGESPLGLPFLARVEMGVDREWYLVGLLGWRCV